ncbi:glycosyltransferase [Christiangramia sp. LLG6405-1]|uniref:glycosyltransferase n=1 Tax=Christiangramia sp. LLG6405-1 TaxID=3160832 RepID=UPI00386D036B
MEIILFGLFILTGIINILYNLSFFSFTSASSEKSQALNLPVSVIVCAKNEEENLQNFIPGILEQNHSNFELILINDASADNSLEVMEHFQNIDPRVKIVNVQNIEAFWANKKYALTLGIKKALNKYLLFTDADCVPQSKDWITEMTNHFTTKEIVLGYGGYFKQKKSLLNKLIRFETLLTAIQYFSYAKLGIPYMGVGRNLAYTSERFYELKGFASHLHIKSGDDDLFVNEAANDENTAICFSESSITRSVPKKSFSEWTKQKRRHVSTAKQYQQKHRVLLGVYYSARLLFWLLFILLSVLQIYPIAVLSILVIKLIFDGIVYYNAAEKLDEKDVIWFYPFFDIFLIFFQLAIFSSNLISKPGQWK